MSVIKRSDIENLYNKINIAKGKIQEPIDQTMTEIIELDNTNNMIKAAEWQKAKDALEGIYGNAGSKEDYEVWKEHLPTENLNFEGWNKISEFKTGKIIKYQDFLDLITVAELTDLLCYADCSGSACVNVDCPCDDGCDDMDCPCDDGCDDMDYPCDDTEDICGGSCDDSDSSECPEDDGMCSQGA